MGVDNRSSLVSDEDFGHVVQDDSSQDVGFDNFICHLLRLAVASTSSNFQPICIVFIAVAFDDYINKPHKQSKTIYLPTFASDFGRFLAMNFSLSEDLIKYGITSVELVGILFLFHLR